MIMKPLPPSDDPQLEMDEVEAILAECLQYPESEVAAAIERARDQHPHCSGDLDRRYRALSALGIRSAQGGEGPDFPAQLGDFRLGRYLGHGGMGVVYEAEQISAGRKVAVKLIRPDQILFEGVRSRFQREVEAVVRLQHPGVVPVHAVGEEGGIPFFAMELIEGCTLADVVHQLRLRSPTELRGRDLVAVVTELAQEEWGHPPVEREPLVQASWPETCLRLVRQVAFALEHAHARGVLHRDVKPSNVMVTPSGRAMLLDFGLARASDTSELTGAGAEIGSLPYLSPERLLDQGVDERSDVYSLGVLLYELLTLRNPFLSTNREQTRRLILESSPPGLRSLNADISWDVETVCQVALDRSPERRYCTAADFARDLSHVLAGRPIEARRLGPLLRARRWVRDHPASALAAFLVRPHRHWGPPRVGWTAASGES